MGLVPGPLLYFWISNPTRPTESLSTPGREDGLHINVETPVLCAAASSVVTHRPHSKEKTAIRPLGLVNIYLFARLLSLDCVHLFVCAWHEDNIANTNCVCCGDGRIDRGTSFISPIPTADPQIVVVTKQEAAQPNSASEQDTQERNRGSLFSTFLPTPIPPPRQESDVGTETGTGPITPKVKPSQSRAHRVGYHSTRLDAPDATAGQTRHNSLLC